MIEELSAASNHLSATLSRYLSASSAIQICYVHGSHFNDILQELPNRVANELLLVTSYETKLKQAKAAISLASNCSTTVTTINALPSEVMTRIFQLVVDAQACDVKDKGNGKITFPKHPDSLAHVCSRWRQIAIGTRALWSHIDIVPYHSLSQGFLDRGEVFIARAAHTPLEVHIINPDFKFAPDDAGLRRFLASVATRTRSLELVLGEIFEDYGLWRIGDFLEKCVPGTLTRLVTTDRTKMAPGFIGRDESSGLTSARSILCRLSKRFLEDLWLPITVLRLRGLYPHWTSNAYHGLVELRLTRDSRASPVAPLSEAQLISLLAASPGLRIFEFDFDIKNPSAAHVPLAPVRLDELEVLNLRSAGYQQLVGILRLLAPGPKPLTVCLNEAEEMVVFDLGTEVESFFGRSNITRLHILNAGFTYLELTALLDHLPHLKILALEQCSCDNWLKDGHRNAPNTPLRLDTLHMLHSCVTVNEFRGLLVDTHSVQKLTFWRCRYSAKGRSSYEDLTEKHMQKLAGACPVVEFIDDNEPSLIAGWELFA